MPNLVNLAATAAVAGAVVYFQKWRIELPVGLTRLVCLLCVFSCVLCCVSLSRPCVCWVLSGSQTISRGRERGGGRSHRGHVET